MKRTPLEIVSSPRTLASRLASIATGLMLTLSTTQAGNLTWDAGNTNNGATIDPADGTWDTTAGNTVWNNGTGDVSWTQNSTTVSTNGAIFGGVDGAYTVTVATQVAVTNLLSFNNSGYTLAGSAGVYIPAGLNINVAAGKTATINCPLPTGNNAVNWTVGAGGALIVNGNIGGMQPKFLGPGAYYLGGNNTPSVTFVLAPVNVTNGTYTAGTSFFIGYVQTVNSVVYNTGTFTVDGPTTTLTHNGGDSIIARAGGTGTYIIRNGATANTGVSGSTVRHLRIGYDNNGGNHATLDVQDGTLNVGTSTLAGQIIFGGNGAPTGLTAVMTQEGGTVNAYGGMTFGGTAGGTGGTASLTVSGGTLYLGAAGFSEGAIHPTETITLSGGTVGALANWSAALPVSLGTSNGDITFQCADSFSTPYNISLTKALTGAGGLKKSGSGTLTFSGPNNYAGGTVVSNGTLAVTASVFPTNGTVTLDGSAGSPVVSVKVANPGQYWAIGTLTCANGSPTTDFQYGALSPSTTVAPVQVSGDVVCTVTPNVTIGGTAIAVGTYPLIKYTGTFSGTLPAVVTLPGYASGYVTNIAVTKTIALVVSTSTYNPALSWRVGDGVWDTTTPNWTQFGSPANYSDGNAVIFDDTASGTSPITVTLNSVVNPLDVTANNSTNKNYIIKGTGGIAGTANLELLGSGTLTLSGTNTYSGGTVVTAGQLNINNGGGASGTAIGTGPLTLGAGATLDNTSGSDVTLRASIPETWNGNFAYLGSANSLNTGVGSVTMGNSLSLAVVSNTFTVGGSIADNGLNYKLTKTGNGTLTLPVGNSFAGGLTLSAGQLNVADPGSVGYGQLTIDGGAIDNISGADLTLSPSTVFVGPGFTFLGSANLSLGTASINFDTAAGTPMVINVVSNTLTFEGQVNLGNNAIIKNGLGTLTLSGTASDSGTPLTVNAGRINLDKSSGNAVGITGAGVTVNTNGLVVITGSSGDQIRDGTGTLTPLNLVGGAFDLNGHSERVDLCNISNGGTLRNGATNSVSTLGLFGSAVLNLAGNNAVFDVTAADGLLTITNPVSGIGSLVKTGAGVLNLYSNNTYAGNTTVSGGTLVLNFPSLTNTSTVTVAANASLELNFVDTNTVAGLVLNGVSKPAGVYSAITDPVYLTGTGSLQVSPTVATNPTNIIFGVTGTSLSLSWPADHKGWTLQTNAVGVASPAAWFPYPGSSGVTNVTITIEPAITNLYFRLVYP